MTTKAYITGKLPGSSGQYALLTESGYRIELAVENDNLTAILFNKPGDQLSSYTVQLPITQSIVSGYFDEDTNEVVFVLTDGSEIRIPASELLKGLATETYVQNYVEEHGGKIDVINVNGEPVEIINKEVFLEIPDITGLASENFVLTKIDEVKDLIPTVPTNVSAFTNDAGYLTEHQPLKTINGQSITGAGDIEIKTYQSMPDEWLACSTMQEFVDQVLSMPGDRAGNAYLGTVDFTPLPEGVYRGELIVEMITDDIALFKINSSDTPPYNWYYNTWTEDFTWKLDSSIRYGYYNEDDGYIYSDEEFTNVIPAEPYLIAMDLNTNKIYAVNPSEYDWIWHPISGSEYTAGENVVIDSDNVISAVDTKYTAGTNITIDEDNVISALTGDCTIGKSFVTTITVGHLQAGTQINAEDKLADILYNILYKEPEAKDYLYWGMTTYIPVDTVEGFDKEEVSSDITDSGITHSFNLPSKQYTSIAYPKSFGNLVWINQDSMPSLNLLNDNFVKVETTVDSTPYYIYYNNSKSTAGIDTYTFKWKL